MAITFPHRREDAGGTATRGLFPTTLLCFTNPGKRRPETLGGGGAETFTAATDEWRNGCSACYRFANSLSTGIAAVERVPFRPLKTILSPLYPGWNSTFGS